MKLRKLLLVIAACAVVVAAAKYTWRGGLMYSGYGLDNAYAQWGAAELVIGYMEENQGRWPGGWDDLRPGFDAGGGRIGGWSYDEYCSRLWIDWEADPEALAAAAAGSEAPTFDVIHPADGIDMAFEGYSGNEVLHRYFKEKVRRDAQ